MPLTPHDVPKGPSRRRALKGLAAATGVVFGAERAAGQSRPSVRRSFVLVHGAWHGGWCWRRVADRLEAAGHKVYAPTLTGLADRSHLLSDAVTLDTHIADVAQLIEWEDLNEVILCGHSYAGFVLAGVAERVLPKLAALVFVDAYVPRDGESMFDVATPSSRTSLQAAIKAGDKVRQPPPAETFNVNEQDRAWVDGKMTPQPVAVALQKVRLSGALDKVPGRAYVRATGYPNPTFDRYLDEARQRRGGRRSR
jgi:pimeloyl-ACP methyl ester carboxylesterase